MGSPDLHHHGLTLVGASSGNLLEPMPDFEIGGDWIKLQFLRFDLGNQGEVDRTPQLAVEAFNLAFGASAIGATALGDETAMLGVVQKVDVVAMRPGPSTSRSRTKVFILS